MNQALDLIALRVANMLQRAGYGAFPVPASKRTDDEHICGVFSQKLAAHLAGLGWIGKSCLLVTPDHGPRVRWVTVLTDTPLKPTGFPMEPRCGKCTACVDICPWVHSPDGILRMSPAKPGLMLRHATGTLRSREEDGCCVSAGCVSGCARMGEKREERERKEEANDRPSAPALPPSGAVAHVMPRHYLYRMFRLLLQTGNTVIVKRGLPRWRGQSQGERPRTSVFFNDFY